MTGSWWKRLIIGLVLIVVALIMVPRFTGNGQFYQPIVIPGILAGGILALVPGAGMFGRTAAFLFGGIVGSGMFIGRSLLFPQTPTGTAMAAAVGILIITIIAIASVGYWPIWAGLLGYGLVEAAYAARWSAQPTYIVDDLIPYVWPALAAASVAFILTMILVLIFGEDRLKLPIEEEEPSETPPPTDETQPAPAAGESETISMTPAQ